MHRLILPLCALAVVNGASAHDSIVRVTFDTKNGVVFATSGGSGILTGVLKGSAILAANQEGLTLPVTLGMGTFHALTSIQLDGDKGGSGGPVFFCMEGVPTGKLTIDRYQRFGFTWEQPFGVNKEGSYLAVLQIAVLDSHGTQVLLHAAPVRIQITKPATQLPDPTSPYVTPPAGAGVAPSVAADH